MVYELKTPKRLLAIRIWTCMALAVVMIVFVLLQNHNHPTIVVEGMDGVWDATHIQFDTSFARLAGPVEYVPNALLTPEAFSASSEVIVGDLPEQCEYLTSRIRLIVPDDKSYELSGYSGGYGNVLFVNGERLSGIEKPTPADIGKPAMTDFMLIATRPSGGVIEVVQQVGRYVFQKSNEYTEWTIGSEALAKKLAATRNAMNAISIGLCLALVLISCLMHSFIFSHKALLWLGLMSLAWALRLGVAGMYPLPSLLMGLDLSTMLRIKYCLTLAAAMLMMLCIHEQLPGVLPKALRFTVYTSQPVLAMMFLLADKLQISRVLSLCVYIGFFCAGWATVCLLRSRVYRQGMRQSLTLAGLCLLLLGLIIELSRSFGLSLPWVDGWMIDAAMLIFPFFQLAAIMLLAEEGIIKTQALRAELVHENASLDKISALREDMMANFSHEIRTPLAVMMGFAQLTATELRDTNASTQTIRDLDAIADEARRMKQIVDELQALSITRTAREEMHPLSIEPIVTQLCRMYAPIVGRKETKLFLDIRDSLPLVFATTDGLTQVLFNLLNNADKHTYGGEIHVFAETRGEGVHLLISDTGVGIAPDLMPRIFERENKGDGGIGMGLVICKDLIESFGGTIYIESEPGQGTKVHINLPT